MRRVLEQWSGTTIALDGTPIWVVAGPLSALAFGVFGFLTFGIEVAVLGCIVVAAVCALGVNDVGRHAVEVRPEGFFVKGAGDVPIASVISVCIRKPGSRGLPGGALASSLVIRYRDRARPRVVSEIRGRIVDDDQTSSVAFVRALHGA